MGAVMVERIERRVLAVAAMLVVGCGSPDSLSPRDGLASPDHVVRVPAPLAAGHCEVEVEGVGVLDLEEDYLPNVIRCENGGADFEALKAQAIAARSVAYYAIETSGYICDSQACQVFSCDGEPDELQRRAVRETAGMYLSFNDTLTYGFYVAGDNAVMGPDCVGDPDVGTEHWVTYNEGKSGFDVTQTELGYVHEPGEGGYGQNRGCMSQWGARCLEASGGLDHRDILRFYYGDDIEVLTASSRCVPSGDGSTSSDDGSEAGTDGLDGPGFGGDVSGGAPGSSDEDAGTGGSGNALPDGYGQDDEAGCSCRGGPKAAGWWLPALVFVGRRRSSVGVSRRTARHDCGTSPSR